MVGVWWPVQHLLQSSWGRSRGELLPEAGSCQRKSLHRENEGVGEQRSRGRWERDRWLKANAAVGSSAALLANGNYAGTVPGFCPG